jgi:hypothetical protein
MNVRQLKGYLSNLPDDMNIILQKEDGKGYYPLDGFDCSCKYIATTSYNGEEFHIEMIDEESPGNDYPRVFVLFPVE